MPMNRRILILAAWLTGIVALVPGFPATAQAQAAAPLTRPTFNVLHTFEDLDSGYSSVIPSGDGDYAGTLAFGGAFGAGMVYKLAADGSETTLYNFTGGVDGALPEGVIADAQGTLYGIAQQGGNQDCSFGFCGVIYEVTPDGRQTVLYAFPGSMTMGWYPTGQLTRDPDGNLYGAAGLGGDMTCPVNTNGCGVVYKLAPDGSYTLLHVFTGGADGAYPNGNLVRDRAGNLYGTTGDYAPAQATACQTLPDVSCGAVFRIAPDGTYTRLHVFGGSARGLTPTAGLTGDAAGNLYGTTLNGGVNPGNLCPAAPPWVNHRGGCGVVYKLAPGGAYSVLYAFQGGSDGISPQGSLVRNTQGGGLYGKAYTFSPGGRYCKHYGGCALVFVVTPDGVKRTVYNFASSDGLEPSTAVVKGYGAQLVGIADQGKNNTATLYSLQFQGGQ